MDLVTALASAAVFPWLCLGFVLWMGRIEDGLPDAVRRAERAPDPPPVLAIPVQARPAHDSLRTVDEPEPTELDAAS